jgi:hypothetical protein
MLRLSIAHPTRPVDLGAGADTRQLGLGLETLTLMPTDHTALSTAAIPHGSCPAITGPLVCNSTR